MRTRFLLLSLFVGALVSCDRSTEKSEGIAATNQEQASSEDSLVSEATASAPSSPSVSSEMHPTGLEDDADPFSSGLPALQPAPQPYSGLDIMKMPGEMLALNYCACLERANMHSNLMLKRVRSDSATLSYQDYKQALDRHLELSSNLVRWYSACQKFLSEGKHSYSESRKQAFARAFDQQQLRALRGDSIRFWYNFNQSVTPWCGDFTRHKQGVLQKSTSQKPSADSDLMQAISTYSNSKHSYCLEYSGQYFTPQPETDTGDGRTFKSASGDVTLKTWAVENTGGTTVEDDFRAALQNDQRQVLSKELGKYGYSSSGNLEAGRSFFEMKTLRNGKWLCAYLEYPTNTTDRVDVAWGISVQHFPFCR